MVDYEPPMEPFRSTFLPAFATTLVAGAIGMLASLLMATWPDIYLISMAIGMAIVAVIALPSSYVAIFWFPVYVGPGGIRSYNLWGLYRTVAWADVSGIGRLNILGLRYLSIKTAGGRAIYVPLFLAKMHLFRERVFGYAGAAHPVVQALA